MFIEHRLVYYGFIFHFLVFIEHRLVYCGSIVPIIDLSQVWYDIFIAALQHIPMRYS